MNGTKIIVISLLFLIRVNSKELPEYLKNLRCSKEDFESCVLEKAALAIPLVARGDPEYHIPKLNPLNLPFIRLISSPELNINLTDVNIHGIDKIRLANFKVQLNDGLFSNILTSDEIVIDGKYSANGKILVMPIKGNGDFSMILKKGIYNVTNIFKVYEKENDEYWKMADSRISTAFEKIEFKLNNLFNGNKQLGDKLNDFLNENWDLLLVDFGPGIEEIITSISKTIFDNFCALVPIKNFFL